MIGLLLRIVFTRLIPLLVLLLALFLGWLSTFPIPEGTFFTLFFPVWKGFMPPVISGGYKECPVVPLPTNDFSISARPARETFVRLPGAPDDEDDAAASAATAAFDMPQQGLGMCCRHTAYDPESVRRTVLHYLKIGGRHIDTADLYQNHEWIGEALQTAMKEYKIPREEIWITTKLWPRFYGTNATAKAIPRMVKELNLDYIDLVLMHAPAHVFSLIGPKTECAIQGLSPKECRLDTWKALSKARASGLVRHVGVSNFNTRQLKEIQALGDAVAPIANNQFQYNPWVPDHQQETFDYCKDQGIAVTAYSSFAGTFMQHMEAFSVDTLQRIAKNHDTTVPQILLKWAMQKGAIVIPGTGNPKHMAENLKAFDLVLSPQEMSEIDALRDDESAKKFFVGPVDET